MQTHFSSQTLAEIFRDLYLAEKSGVLQVSRGDVEKRIYFDRGMILYAESNLDEESLGKRLIHEGKISAGALAEARRNISEPKDLAQALINRGLVGKETLSHTVRYLVERIVASLFHWEGGTARFSDGYLLQEIFETDILMTFEVLLRGISTMVGFEPIKEAMRGLDNRLKVLSPTPVPLERLALSPAHGYILSRVDGSTSLGEVIAILPPGEEDLACRFLYGLLVMGVITFDPPVQEGPFHAASILRDHADQVALERLQERMIAEAYESIRNKPPHEVLGVTSSASRETVDTAYEQAKERFSRERILPRVRDKCRAELAVIESRLVEAYLSLNQASPRDGVPRAEEPTTGAGKDSSGVVDLLVRVEMDKTKTKMAIEENVKIAEGHHAKARKFMREGDFHNAIQYAKLAISYHPGDARFYFLLGECQVKNPEARWQRMAEQNYLKATELDPWNSDYRISLGRFYRRRGLKLRARKQFEQVLELMPAHEVALEELQTLR